MNSGNLCSMFIYKFNNRMSNIQVGTYIINLFRNKIIEKGIRMADVLSWEYVKKELENSENSVLLGNGFSRSYKAEDFDQSKILAEMESLKDKNAVDIEKCIEETIDLLRENEKTVPKDIIAKWIKEKLHKEFIDKLFTKMPDSIRDKDNYNESLLKPYNEFLSMFDKFFTLNYDPVLYWLTMHFQGNGDASIKNFVSLEEELTGLSEDDKKYVTKQKKLEKENDKLREKTFDSFIDKEKYKMIINYKDTCLYNKTLKEADEDKILKEKVTKTIYESLTEKKEQETNCSEEFEKLEKFKDSCIENYKKEIEQRKENVFINSTDGFFPEGNILKWNTDNSQNVYYLHGAFHILHKDDETIKITKSKENSSNKMLDNIKKEWDNGFESLTVLEASSDEKMKKINDYEYLTYCYDELKNLAGNLVTFGVSFEDSDNHIIEAINNNNKLEKIFIGCYDIPCDNILDKFSNKDKIKLFSTKNFFDTAE